MLELYVSGHRVGSWAETEHIFAELATRQLKIELRDETGQTIGHFVPADPSPFPAEHEIERRCAAGGGTPLAEFWKKMGVE